MKEFLGFFEEDWRKVPANYRYIFYAGAFLIAMAWLGDHWGDQQQYHLLGSESNEIAFQIGFLFMVVFFVILVIKQIGLWNKIRSLKGKYPVNRLNQDLYLVNFQGFVYLIDEKNKQRVHLKTPQTVTDLGFSLFGWETVEIPHNAPPETVVTLTSTGKEIKLGDYPEIPGGIYTQP